MTGITWTERPGSRGLADRHRVERVTGIRGIRTNQPFSAWDQVFPEAAMTVTAVDRLVHHSTIFELNVESYRRKAAAERKTMDKAAVSKARK